MPVRTQARDGKDATRGIVIDEVLRKEFDSPICT